MPQRAKRPCSEPGCATLVDAGRYCIAHQLATARPREARLNAHQRGYGATWRRLRLMILAHHPLCADPFGEHARHQQIEAAIDVDHIIARRAGGRDEASNLQALCHSCHSRKTAAGL